MAPLLRASFEVLNLSKTAQKLKAELSRLSSKDRAELAHYLLHSLDETDPEAQAAWDAELADRLNEIKSGKARGEPAGRVIAKLRKKYS
jgi:putative addiction module component (TIGR02574 family)